MNKHININITYNIKFTKHSIIDRFAKKKNTKRKPK